MKQDQSPLEWLAIDNVDAICMAGKVHLAICGQDTSYVRGYIFGLSPLEPEFICNQLMQCK